MPGPGSSREHEEARRKTMQMSSMMDEIDDTSSSEEDRPSARSRTRPSSGSYSLSGGGGGRSSVTRTSFKDGGMGMRPPSAGATGSRTASGTMRFSLAGPPPKSTARSAASDPFGPPPGSARRASALRKPTLEDEFDSRPKPSTPRGESKLDDAGGKASEGKLGDGIEAMRTFVTRQVSRAEGVVQCYVERVKGAKNLIHPLYKCYLETGGRFMMCSKKRMGKKTSNYLIGLEESPPDRSSPKVVGKLRANWTGSGYHVFDHGLSPEDSVTSSTLRKELVSITFDYDKMGPGKLSVLVPRVTPSGTSTVFKPRSETDTLAAVCAAEGTTKIMKLTNKRPKWDESVGGHVLNFHGRVTASSVKNFQLACEETGDDTILQFGRVDKNKFTMDFQWPLSAVQAFGIVLATLDGKIADSKGFEQMKKFKEKMK